MLFIYGTKQKVLNNGSFKDDKLGEIQYTVFQDYMAAYSHIPLWAMSRKKYELLRDNDTLVTLNELTPQSKSRFQEIFDNSKMPARYKFGMLFLIGGFVAIMSVLFLGNHFYRLNKENKMDKSVYKPAEVADNFGPGLIFSTDFMSPDAKWQGEYYKVQKIEGDSVFCEKMNTQKTFSSYDDFADLPNDLSASGQTKIYSKKGLINNGAVFEFIIKNNQVETEPGNRVHSFFKK